ncbi:MAG: hypothetical protein SWX82_03190 [Cyanobacteriota bacterium]|nr:hypothetical protein [Cyanobacteriota bacterium]
MKVAFLTSIRQLYPPLSQLLLFIYWTIVIALLMSDSSAIAIITIYLLDNSYCSADERHSE